MLVKDIMSRNVVSVTKDTLLKKVSQIMVDKQISGLPVVDEEGYVISMITKSTIVELSLPSALRRAGDTYGLLKMDNREYMTKLQEVANKRVEDVILKKEIISATSEMPVADAAAKMYTHGFRRLPVLDENKKMIGIITYTDIASVIAEK